MEDQRQKRAEVHGSLPLGTIKLNRHEMTRPGFLEQDVR
jgi:hypothetical protein